MLTRISDGLVKHFCLDCRTPFCAMCSSGHVDHAQIQVRKSDYKDVVLSQDLGLHISVSGIQTYRLCTRSFRGHDARRIIYVHERPQPRPVFRRPRLRPPKNVKGDFFCKACQRRLMKPSPGDSYAKYCSLQCMLRFEGDAASQRLPSGGGDGDGDGEGGAVHHFPHHFPVVVSRFGSETQVVSRSS